MLVLETKDDFFLAGYLSGYALGTTAAANNTTTPCSTTPELTGIIMGLIIAFTNYRDVPTQVHSDSTTTINATTNSLGIRSDLAQARLASHTYCDFHDKMDLSVH